MSDIPAVAEAIGLRTRRRLRISAALFSGLALLALAVLALA